MVAPSDLVFSPPMYAPPETAGTNVTREDEDMSAPATTPQQGPVQPGGALSRLIEEALDTGLSYQRLADKAVDRKTGETVSKPYLQKLVKNPPASAPNPVQMRAIAAALGASERRVKAAVAEQWLEYEATELAGYDEEVRIIVGHLAGKSPQELRRWRAMIEADERARRED